MRAVWTLALLLAGCLPVAVLRSLEPVRGEELALGLSLMRNPFSNRDRYPLIPLPYLAYSRGDGAQEENFSVQLGLRAGLKATLAPGVALDLGITPPLFLGDAGGFPFVLDGGVLLGQGGFYLSPRLHLAVGLLPPCTPGGYNLFCGPPVLLVPQAAFGYMGPEGGLEAGAFVGENPIIYLAGALRFRLETGP